jgi:hypothetical protein
MPGTLRNAGAASSTGIRHASRGDFADVPARPTSDAQQVSRSGAKLFTREMFAGAPPTRAPGCVWVGLRHTVPDVAEVSGRAFLGLTRYVKDTRGDEFLRGIVTEAGPATVRVFATKIGVHDWYEYPAYTAFLRAIDRQMGNGDRKFCREIGAIAGKRDLGTIFRVFTALASAERLIRSCSRVWPSYYRSAGRMEAVAWAADETILRIHDFPEMHGTHCRLMEGWMISTMATIGFRVNEDARESRCPSRGDPYHEFTCTWTRAR